MADSSAHDAQPLLPTGGAVSGTGFRDMWTDKEGTTNAIVVQLGGQPDS
jgi:hypothetical protein